MGNRKGPGRGSAHRKRNPAGSKIARQFVKQSGLPWKGEVYHTGELTRVNRLRQIARVERRFGIKVAA